jgi:hypothetical protein
LPYGERVKPCRILMGRSSTRRRWSKRPYAARMGLTGIPLLAMWSLASATV